MNDDDESQLIIPDVCFYCHTEADKEKESCFYCEEWRNVE